MGIFTMQTWIAFWKRILDDSQSSSFGFSPELLSKGADLGKMMNSDLNIARVWWQWELKEIYKNEDFLWFGGKSFNLSEH